MLCLALVFDANWPGAGLPGLESKQQNAELRITSFHNSPTPLRPKVPFWGRASSKLFLHSRQPSAQEGRGKQREIAAPWESKKTLQMSEHRSRKSYCFRGKEWGGHEEQSEQSSCGTASAAPACTCRASRNEECRGGCFRNCIAGMMLMACQFDIRGLIPRCGPPWVLVSLASQGIIRPSGGGGSWEKALYLRNDCIERNAQRSVECQERIPHRDGFRDWFVCTDSVCLRERGTRKAALEVAACCEIGKLGWHIYLLDASVGQFLTGFRDQTNHQSRRNRLRPRVKQTEIRAPAENGSHGWHPQS
eukprot:gene19195-biopygen6966